MIGHSRKIIAADPNMKSFEDGVINPIGLHGVMIRNIAVTNSRVVNTMEDTILYNSIWDYFGAMKFPPGTYYYNKSAPDVYFWNIFNQGLIRPELLSRFESIDS